MPRYRITQISYIDDKLVNANEEIDSDGVPGPHWEPLDEAAKKARVEADRRLKELLAPGKKGAGAEPLLVIGAVSVP